MPPWYGLPDAGARHPRSCIVGTYTLTSDVVAYVALRLNGCLNAVDASCLVEYEEHRLNSLVLSLCPCTECGECTVAVLYELTVVCDGECAVLSRLYSPSLSLVAELE